MTKEIERFKNTKKKLDEVSESFCVAKWSQVTLHLQNGFNHSCHHPVPVKTPLEEIEKNPAALHNTTYKKERRKEMLNGIRCKECQYCWNIEDLPGDHVSDRLMKSSAPWSESLFDQVVNSDWDDDINPSYVEVSFSNVCNFKCSYCSPVYSSRWTEEIAKNGPYELSTIKLNDLDSKRDRRELPIHHTEHNPYVEAFWKWWPDLVKDLQIFRITGGEPLLDKNTFKVLDYLNNNPHPDLSLAINSNFGIPDKNMDSFISISKKLLNNISSLHMFTSVDTSGAPAEYSRYGLDYMKWKETVDKVLTELPTVKVTVMCTTNILSLVGFKELLEFIYEMKLKHFNECRKVPITLDMSILHWPNHLDVAILPEQFNTFMDNSLEYMQMHQEGVAGNPYYKGFYDFEIEKMERFIKYLISGKKDNINECRKDFSIFIDEYDRRRGTDFKQTFPELVPFYEECSRI